MPFKTVETPVTNDSGEAFKGPGRKKSYHSMSPRATKGEGKEEKMGKEKSSEKKESRNVPGNVALGALGGGVLSGGVIPVGLLTGAATVSGGPREGARTFKEFGPLYKGIVQQGRGLFRPEAVDGSGKGAGENILRRAILLASLSGAAGGGEGHLANPQGNGHYDDHGLHHDHSCGDILPGSGSDPQLRSRIPSGTG